MNPNFQTTLIGNHFIYLQEVDSTNRYGMDLLASHPQEGTVICAAHQTMGKGQAGSQWLTAPHQNLTFSVIMKPDFLANRPLYYLSKMLALALCQFLRILLPHASPCIKWPNDLLIHRQKIAGILIENLWEGSQLQYSIWGIGVNVNQWIFPSEIAPNTTSLYQQIGIEWDIEKLLEALIFQIEYYYKKLQAGEYEQIDEEYLQFLYGYRQEVNILWQGKEWTAFVEGIQPTGEIIMVIEGKRRVFGLKEMQWILN
jgi:BirA family biotin operon repressor/biotin-[acetyl-CoA-carboxylase] ligase